MSDSTSGAGCLDGAAILGCEDHKMERVETPEWGGHVFVRTITGTERDEFEQQMLDSRGKRKAIVENIRAGLLVRSVCDEKGQLLFSRGDVKALGKKNARVLDRLFGVAQRVSGLSERDVDELVKNSIGAQSADSTTA